VIRHIEPVQQNEGEEIGEDHTHSSCQQTQHGKFHAKDRGDTRATRSQRLEHHHLPDAAKTRTGYAGGEDHQPGENGKRRKESHDQRDLMDDPRHCIQQIGDVDDGHSGIGDKQRPLHLRNPLGIHMHSAVPDHRQVNQRPL